MQAGTLLKGFTLLAHLQGGRALQTLKSNYKCKLKSNYKCNYASKERFEEFPKCTFRLCSSLNRRSLRGLTSQPRREKTRLQIGRVTFIITTNASVQHASWDPIRRTPQSSNHANARSRSGGRPVKEHDMAFEILGERVRRRSWYWCRLWCRRRRACAASLCCMHCFLNRARGRAMRPLIGRVPTSPAAGRVPHP